MFISYLLEKGVTVTELFLSVYLFLKHPFSSSLVFQKLNDVPWIPIALRRSGQRDIIRRFILRERESCR